MNVGKGARVLEIACGTGRNFPHIQRVIGPEGHLVGLDYTPEMLAAAERQVRHRGWKNVTLVRADAAERVFEEASFDAALCVLALSGIPRHRDAIARCHEALAPGATFAVCDAQPFPGRLRALNPLIRAIYEPLAGWDADRNVPEDLRSAFGNASLRTQNFGSFFIATAKKR
jgi:demethylmenaquinone methyltransferase/2-methoxy-6-polyprenyl-1,4-benzoquinol methylase